MNEQERNDLQSTITHALEEMKAEAGALVITHGLRSPSAPSGAVFIFACIL